MVMTPIPFQTLMRAAAVDLMTDYGASAGIQLAVYPARPASIHPPHAFVDVMRETIAYPGRLRQRTVQVDIVMIHGLFDSKEAVDQRDAFVDGFLDWVLDRIHAANANTTIGGVAVEDDPTYVPDWLRPELQRTYFATRITLEGFAGT